MSDDDQARARARAQARVEAELAKLGAELTPPVGWKARVLAEATASQGATNALPPPPEEPSDDG